MLAFCLPLSDPSRALFPVHFSQHTPLDCGLTPLGVAWLHCTLNPTCLPARLAAGRAGAGVRPPPCLAYNHRSSRPFSLPPCARQPPLSLQSDPVGQYILSPPSSLPCPRFACPCAPPPHVAWRQPPGSAMPSLWLPFSCNINARLAPGCCPCSLVRICSPDQHARQSARPVPPQRREPHNALPHRIGRACLANRHHYQFVVCRVVSRPGCAAPARGLLARRARATERCESRIVGLFRAAARHVRRSTALARASAQAPGPYPAFQASTPGAP